MSLFTYQSHQQTFYLQKSAEVSDLWRTFYMNMKTLEIDLYTANISILLMFLIFISLITFVFYCILFSYLVLYAIAKLIFANYFFHSKHISTYFGFFYCITKAKYLFNLGKCTERPNFLCHKANGGRG